MKFRLYIGEKKAKGTSTACLAGSAEIPSLSRSTGGRPAMESPTSAASRVDFYGFLDRMRRPAAAGLFRSIKRSVSQPPRPAPHRRPHGLRVPPLLRI